MENFPSMNSTSDLMNKKSQPIESISKTLEHEDLTIKKVSILPITDNNNNNHHHRTVLAHHIFHANIQQTFLRWLRETPV